LKYHAKEKLMMKHIKKQIRALPARGSYVVYAWSACKVRALLPFLPVSICGSHKVFLASMDHSYFAKYSRSFFPVI
jgi:hypothetical protein